MFSECLARTNQSISDSTAFSSGLMLVGVLDGKMGPTTFSELQTATGV
jgi:hypothetical protein